MHPDAQPDAWTSRCRSNLERLLFELLGRDGAAIAELMAPFRVEGTVSVDGGRARTAARRVRLAAASTTRPPPRSSAACYDRAGMLIDPHTAVGVGVAEALER